MPPRRSYSVRPGLYVSLQSASRRISEMTKSDIETVVVGGGAAGIAAARRLCQARIKCLVVEARPRLGGRAWTVADPSGFALDLGCGWLHSADRNPWVAIAEEQRRTIDRTPPPWTRPALPHGFPEGDQREFRKAQWYALRRSLQTTIRMFFPTPCVLTFIASHSGSCHSVQDPTTALAIFSGARPSPSLSRAC